MIDLEKILVKIVLVLVTVLFIVLLFNSCKTQKKVVRTNTDTKVEQTTKIDTETTDNSKTDEDYTEIVYVLDSAQVIDVFGNSEQHKIRVSQIKVKTSHVSTQNDIDSKIVAKEEKTSQMAEKTQEKTKEKPITRKIVVLSLFSLLLAFVIYMFIRYRH